MTQSGTCLFFVRRIAIGLAVVALCVVTSSPLHATLAHYDAGPAGGGPVDLDPVLQGWSDSEVDRSGGALTNVFNLQPDAGTGYNATLIDDQQGTGNPSPNDNPRYEIFLDDGDFAHMFQYGWQFDFRFRPIEGGNFVAWGINPSTATDPGWGLGTTRERVGFSVSIDPADNSAVVSPIGGSAANLGPGSADAYHLITAVGAAGASTFDLSIDGVFDQTLDISDGTSNSGSDNRTFWESGSSGGTGRSAAWNLVSLTLVPEPSSMALCALSLIGLAACRRRR